MKTFFVPVLSSILLYQGICCHFTAAIAVPTPISQQPAANQVRQQQESKSFAQWCLERQTLPATTQHTVNMLLKYYKTDSCQKADERTSQETLLNLSNSQIIDLRPLARMNKLEYLILSNNKINDLRPLAGLRRLIHLNLDGNQIRDLSPLAGLKNISALDLSSNQIRDLRPLIGLSKIYNIQLRNNQISDLTPLASLTNLGTINLEQNYVSDVKPLLVLRRRLEYLVLSQNQVSNIKPLAGMDRLIQLHLRNNPISDKTCPVQSKTPFFLRPQDSFLTDICRF